MAFVVTIEALTPPVRYDDVPYTRVHLFESTSSSGPWSQIDDLPLPAYPDPSEPITINITTTNASAEAGLWYQAEFVDGVGNTSPRTSSYYNQADTYINYRPSVKAVADKIRDRTIDEFDNELGTFTSETIPSAAQVEDIINSAVDEVTSVLGENIPDAPAPASPDSWRVSAQNIVALLAAAKVELTHYGKEVARQNSPYDALLKEFDRSLLWLSSKMGLVIPGSDTGGGGGSSTDVPSGSHIAIWGNDVDDPYNDMMTRPT